MTVIYQTGSINVVSEREEGVRPQSNMFQLVQPRPLLSLTQLCWNFLVHSFKNIPVHVFACNTKLNTVIFFCYI
jgi:hypothetical protein